MSVSQQRLGKKIHTLRLHDADDTGVTEALKPGGVLAGLTALRAAGEIEHVSLGMCVRGEAEDGGAGRDLVLRIIREAPDRPAWTNSAPHIYGRTV